jgi:hypothetical protein
MIPGGSLNGTLTQAGSPYVVTGNVTVTTSLTVEAGVLVRFRSALSMLVYGTLATQGTLEQPVIFTSASDTVGGQPAAGNWTGIRASGGAALALAHTFVRYGGASSGANLMSSSGTISSFAWNGGGCRNSGYDGIQVTSSATTLTGLAVEDNARHGITLSTPANAAVALTGLTVQANGGNGITLTPSGPLSTSVLDQLVVNDNVGRAIAITGNATSIPWGTLSGSGNGTNGIYVAGSLWGSSRRWEWSGASPNFPYVLDNLQVYLGDTLAIAAGAVVKFLPSGHLYLNATGTGSALQTLGTADRPVWFTSIKDDTHGGDTNGDGGASVPGPGDYVGITCYGTSVLSLAQTWMAYGGAGSTANLASATGSIGSLTWNGGGCVRSAHRGMGVSAVSLSVSGVRFALNLGDGASITPGSNGSVTGCDFFGNGGTYGLCNTSTTYTIDAFGSWWGDASGPNDPSPGPPGYNPGGLGSRVSDYVIYLPWATTSQTNEQPIGFALLSPVPGGVDFQDILRFRWGHATAPDGGSVSYDLQVDDDPSFGSPEINQAGLPDTTFDASGLLGFDHVYYWRVLANDAGGGQWVSAPAASCFRTYPVASGIPGFDPPTSPVVFRVGDPSPNPFRGPTALPFSLPASARVRLDVFDIGGRLVRTLVDGRVGPGEHVVAWDGHDRAGRLVESGVYFYRFQSDRGDAVRRAVILR